MKQIFTIGYEGSTVDTLVDTLVNLDIKVLADVRELPLSRKKGLSKTSLSERLSEHGIDYVHFKALGDPKEGRQAARAGKYDVFEKIYLRHLRSQYAQGSLETLLKVAESRRTCMLCFEKCAEVCHRSYIADQAAFSGFEIYNLVADRPEKYLQNEFDIPRYHPRQSLAAAE